MAQADYWTVYHNELDNMMMDKLGPSQQQLNQAMAAQQGNIYAQTGAQAADLARAGISGNNSVNQGAVANAQKEIAKQAAGATAQANANLNAEALAQQSAQAQAAKLLAERQQRAFDRQNEAIAANATGFMNQTQSSVSSMAGVAGGV